MSVKAKTSTGRRRMKFLPEEDEKLRELVAKYGKSWNDIAKRLPGRNVRQCRERWKHYLSSDRAKSPWSNEEDILLFQKFMELGPKWTKIAKFFDNRTDIQIKTRWMKRFGSCPPMIVPPKIQAIQPPMMENINNNNNLPEQNVINKPVQNNPPMNLQPIQPIQPPINLNNPPLNPIKPAQTSLIPITNDTGGSNTLPALSNSSVLPNNNVLQNSSAFPKIADDVVCNHDQKMFYTFDDICNEVPHHQEVDMFPAENSDNLFNIYLDF